MYKNDCFVEEISVYLIDTSVDIISSFLLVR